MAKFNKRKEGTHRFFLICCGLWDILFGDVMGINAFFKELNSGDISILQNQLNEQLYLTVFLKVHYNSYMLTKRTN